MRQQKGNFFDTVRSQVSRTSRDRHSSDLDGGASWDEHPDHGDTSLRCLKQTTELFKGEEVEAGIHVAPGSDGLRPPSVDSYFLGSKWLLRGGCLVLENIHAA